MSDLKGRVALVTGGSRGIGKAVALALAKGGQLSLSTNASATTTRMLLPREYGKTVAMLQLSVRTSRSPPCKAWSKRSKNALAR